MVPNDKLASDLPPLIAAADWAALVRYFLTHQYEPALSAAVTILRTRASQNPRWSGLAALLIGIEKADYSVFLSNAPTQGRNPFRPLPEIPTSDPASNVTVLILDLFGKSVFCQLAIAKSPKDRKQYFEPRFRNATQTIAAATAIGDHALAARYQIDLAHILHEDHQIEKAVKAWRDAVDQYSALARIRPERFNGALAAVLNDLGIIQHASEDFSGACASFRSALGIYRIWGDEADTATTLHNLGTAHRELCLLDAAREHLEEALRMREILAKSNPAKHTHEVAGTLSSLSTVFRDLNRPELARAAVAQALAIYRNSALPADTANTLNNFGTIERRLGNLPAAQTYFSEAAEIYRKLNLHRDEAVVLGNLGGLQRNLEMFDAAEHSYRAAMQIELEIAQPGSDRGRFAHLLLGLGNVQLDRKHYKIAIELFQAAADGFNAATDAKAAIHQGNRLLALIGVGNAQIGEGDHRSALETYKAVTELFERAPTIELGTWLRERQASWLTLGELHRREAAAQPRPDYSAAREALRRAVNCAEQFRGHIRDRKLRAEIHGKMFRSYEALILTCVDTWNITREEAALEEAVHTAEQSRSRSLVERLSENEWKPKKVASERFVEFLSLRREIEALKFAAEMDRSRISPRSLFADEANGLETQVNLGAAIEKYQDSLRALRPRTTQEVRPTAEKPIALSSPSTIGIEDLQRAIAEAEVKFESFVSEFKTADPEWDPDRPVKPLTAAEIQAVIPNDKPTAFVQFALAAEGGVALIIKRNGVHAVPLPGLSEDGARRMADAWLTTYGGRTAGSSNWEDGVDAQLAAVTTALHPLWSASELKSAARLVLSPNRWLHIFPLHACILEDGRRAADVFDISYSPGFSVLQRCVNRQRSKSGQVLLIGNPTGDLDFTEIEVAIASSRYSEAEALQHASVHKAAIFAKAPSCWLLHYTGHAEYNDEAPLLSSLVLETKNRTQRAKWFSLNDAFCHLDLNMCSLAILNGCESGRLLPDQADEYLALSSGFLHAGAVCVLATLWAVHDLPSTLIMDRFYTLRSSGESVATSLKEAARWLREDIRSLNDLEDIVDDLLTRVPSGMSLRNGKKLGDVCRNGIQKYAARAGTKPPFASPAYWAPLVAIGKAWTGKADPQFETNS